ncbi:MAG: ABC transporter permease [Bacteroidia bacterium]|nr:ABC transporter permease [Bacteroidia bacterium]
MWKYALKRLGIFLPGLLLISMLVFYLSTKSPVNELASQCNVEAQANFSDYEACLRKNWEIHQLDKPLFYFALQSFAEPDTLHLIYDHRQKAAAEELCLRSGDWPRVQNYFLKIRQLDQVHAQERSRMKTFSSREAFSQMKAEIIALRGLGKVEAIKTKLDQIHDFLQKQDSLQILSKELEDVRTALDAIQHSPNNWKSYIPWISWYGTDNRYHNWIKGAIQFEWGYSYLDNSPINEEIKKRFWVTFSFALLSTLLVFLISIPLGVWAARNKDKLPDKLSGSILFALDSVPSFWMGLLLLMTFANPYLLKLFPAEYLVNAPSLLTKIMSMILPLITYTYGSIAILSRMSRNALLEVSEQDYIRTARAKGLRENQVVWKHGMRNALLPMISLSVYVLPALFSGSVIIEEIFNIPGLGTYIYTAVALNNTPVILAVFSILGFLTLLGYLISDILTYKADPRINLNES